MATVTDHGNDDFHVFLVIAENVFETVAQVVKRGILTNLRLKDAWLDLGRLSPHVEAKAALLRLKEVLRRVGRELIHRRTALLHGRLDTARGRGDGGSCHAVSEHLLAGSLLLVDVTTVVVVVLSRHRRLVLDCNRRSDTIFAYEIQIKEARLSNGRSLTEASVVGGAEFITLSAGEATLDGFVDFNRVRLREKGGGYTGVRL